MFLWLRVVDPDRKCPVTSNITEAARRDHKENICFDLRSNPEWHALSNVRVTSKKTTEQRRKDDIYQPMALLNSGVLSTKTELRKFDITSLLIIIGRKRLRFS